MKRAAVFALGLAVAAPVAGLLSQQAASSPAPQIQNGRVETRRGAAIMLPDHRLNDELLTTLTVLLQNPNKLKAMRAAMFELSHPRAAEKIASALLTLAGD